MATKIQLRRDTAADWTANNPTLAAGEFGWESDTNRFKIGDGATAWTSLAYASDSDTVGITFVGDDSTGTLVSQNETFKIAGGTGITTAVSGDTLTVTNTGTGTITALNNQAENRLTTIGSTTTELDGEANLTFDGSTLAITGGLTATTSIANDAISITDNKITTTRSNDDLTLTTSGTGNIVVDQTFEVRAYNNGGIWSGTDTILFTGNAATGDKIIKCEPPGIGNVSLLLNPTNGGYVKIQHGSTGSINTWIRGGEIELRNTGADNAIKFAVNGSSFSQTILGPQSGDISADRNIRLPGDPGPGFSGTQNLISDTATQTLYNKTLSNTTLSGSTVLDGVTITDNTISTNRSNDNLEISANGTGKVNISNSDAVPEDNLVYTNGFGSIDRNKGVRIWESVSAQGEMTTATDRDYGHLLAKEWRLTSGLTSSDSDNRYRAFQSVSAVDLNGGAITPTSSYSGPQGANGNTYLDNSNASAATINHSTGFYSSVYVSPTVGAITAANTYGIRSEIDFDGSSASVSGTNGYLFHAAMYSDGGTTSLTNGYGVYISDLSLATNKYAFYDATNSLSVFGDIQTQGVSITDNLITTNRSNDNLNIEANGTGRINISTTGSDFFNDTDNALFVADFGSSANVSTMGLIQNDSLDANTTAKRYLLGLAQNTTLTGSSATNSNFRPRAFQGANTVDMAGYSYTRTGNTRGPLGFDVRVNVLNSSATASTLEYARGAVASVDAYSDSSGYFEGDLTINNADGLRSQVFVDSYIGTGNVTVGTGTAYHARAYAGTSDTITTFYGFYNEGSSGGGTVTNEYAFYDGANALSRFGAVILANQASDPSGVTDSSHIYAKDDAGSSEVYVRDEAGNVTKISPHNEAGEWEYYSVNKNTGKKVRVNMERMIRRLEEITGETFIENE